MKDAAEQQEHEGLRDRLVAATQELVYQSAVEILVSTSMGMDEKYSQQMLEVYERSGRVSESTKARYLGMIETRDFLSSLRERAPTDLFAHWLKADSSSIQFAITATPTHLQIHGELGRSIYHSVLATAFAVEARVKSFTLGESYSMDPEQLREHVLSKMKDLIEKESQRLQERERRPKK